MHLLKLHVALKYKMKTNLLKKVGKPIKLHQYLLMAKLNTRNDRHYNFSDYGNIGVGIVGDNYRVIKYCTNKIKFALNGMEI